MQFGAEGASGIELERFHRGRASECGGFEVKGGVWPLLACFFGTAVLIFSGDSDQSWREHPRTNNIALQLV